MLRWAVPRGFTVKCLCHQPRSPLPVSPAPVLYPHPAVRNEKPPLFGVFAIMMKAFFFFLLRIHLCIPEGAFITPCPGCRRLPPSDPPAQKGSLVRHMKPGPPDIWTRRSPLAEHEGLLNATDSERRALVPGPNGPAKWMQLGTVGAGGGGERGDGSQSERQVCFRKRLLETLLRQ